MKIEKAHRLVNNSVKEVISILDSLNIKLPKNEGKAYIHDTIWNVCYKFYMSAKEDIWNNCPHRHITQSFYPLCSYEKISECTCNDLNDSSDGACTCGLNIGHCMVHCKLENE